jgi:hypothetical protein
MLNDALQHLHAIETLVATRQQRRSDAKAATNARDSALISLESWMRDFRAVARIALRTRPQSLETLGMRA